jgi:hypothetical protein
MSSINPNKGFIGLLGSDNPIIQVVLGLILIAIVYLVFISAQSIFFTTKNAADRFVYLIKDTNLASSGPITVFQNPILHPTEAQTIGLSENERTGIEFAYSFFLLVESDAFTNTGTLKHVLNKGYQKAWPLMGPAVFLWDNSNTLRVAMNSYSEPYMYVDIQNIPVKKWFHVVLNCYKNTLEVHINGNLASRINFHNTLPYQNFGDIHVFNNASYQLNMTNRDPISISGAMPGYISSLVYARYALSFNEIQGLMNAGPSKKVVRPTHEDTANLPPYFADTWWTGGV